MKPKARLVLLLVTVAAGCQYGDNRTSSRGLLYRDDEDAGVRCYDWTSGESAISCVKVR